MLLMLYFSIGCFLVGDSFVLIVLFILIPDIFTDFIQTIYLLMFFSFHLLQFLCHGYQIVAIFVLLLYLKPSLIHPFYIYVG